MNRGITRNVGPPGRILHYRELLSRQWQYHTYWSRWQTVTVMYTPKKVSYHFCYFQYYVFKKILSWRELLLSLSLFIWMLHKDKTWFNSTQSNCIAPKTLRTLSQDQMNWFVWMMYVFLKTFEKFYIFVLVHLTHCAQTNILYIYILFYVIIGIEPIDHYL